MVMTASSYRNLPGTTVGVAGRRDRRTSSLTHVALAQVRKENISLTTILSANPFFELFGTSAEPFKKFEFVSKLQRSLQNKRTLDTLKEPRRNFTNHRELQGTCANLNEPQCTSANSCSTFWGPCRISKESFRNSQFVTESERS